MNTTTTFVKSLLLSIPVSAASLSQPALAAETASRPNFVFIIADDCTAAGN